jgi:poly(A) polymerase
MSRRGPRWRAACDAGHEAVFAGGAVRDQLLGLRESDVDIATSATPAQVQALFPRTVLVGEAFGVVKVPAGRGHYDVATFRRDVGTATAATRGHRTLHAGRGRQRDFTINGLVEDPFTGEVTDLVGGRAGLQAGILRAIGEPGLRFREDALRLLRGVRFPRLLPSSCHARRDACRRRAPAPRVRRACATSWARCWCTSRRRAIELLDETGLLPVILPSCRRLRLRAAARLRPGRRGCTRCWR